MNIWKDPVGRKLLTPFSIIYNGITSIRNHLYDRGVFKTNVLNIKVISVGNITVGGTGKTPLVETIARRLQQQGKQIAIQSRGYGRSFKNMTIVSDGKTILATPKMAGDEPYLLAQKLPGIPILVGADRYQTSLLAIEKFKPDVLILDDAFQHRRLHRDVNIVTMDASSPWGNGYLLPAGPLRESKIGLKRASLIILTRAHDGNIASQQAHELSSRTKVPVILSRHEPLDWIDLRTKKIYPLDFFRKNIVIAMAGIGHPTSFLETLTTLNIKPVEFINFRDHYWYLQRDIENIRVRADRNGATAVLTTEKDGVRMLPFTNLRVPVYCLRIQCIVDDSVLDDMILE